MWKFFHKKRHPSTKGEILPKSNCARDKKLLTLFGMTEFPYPNKTRDCHPEQSEKFTWVEKFCKKNMPEKTMSCQITPEP
jgi:hypothetical protein